MIRVDGTPMNPNKPTDAAAARKTRTTPMRLKLNLRSTKNCVMLKLQHFDDVVDDTLPRENMMYTSITR